MTERLITGPVAMAVSMQAARAAARINGADLDEMIESQVRTITEELEHLTGRAVIEQTWRVSLDAFPEAVQLPKPPVASVSSVKFFDLDGIERTLDPQDYMVDAASEPGYIVPAPGRAWPATANRINAVVVDVVCGYGPTGESVPAAIKGYILAKVQEHFAPAGTPQSPNLARLLDRSKVY